MNRPILGITNLDPCDFTRYCRRINIWHISVGFPRYWSLQIPPRNDIWTSQPACSIPWSSCLGYMCDAASGIAPFKNDSKVHQNPFCLPSVIFGFTQFSSSFCLLPFVTCRLATGCTLARLCGLRLSEKEQQQSAWIILDPQLLLASSKIMLQCSIYRIV